MVIVIGVIGEQHIQHTKHSLVQDIIQFYVKQYVISMTHVHGLNCTIGHACMTVKHGIHLHAQAVPATCATCMCR